MLTCSNGVQLRNPCYSRSPDTTECIGIFANFFTRARSNLIPVEVSTGTSSLVKGR